MINYKTVARGVMSRTKARKLHRDTMWAAKELRKLASSNRSVNNTRQITLDCLDNMIKEENETHGTLDFSEEAGTSLQHFCQSRNVHEIVKNLSEAEKASGLGSHLSQHDKAISKGTIPLSVQQMPDADRVMGGLNPCMRIFLESCFCKHPTTNFHVDSPETSLVQSPAKKQTTSTLSDDSDDDLLDLGSPASYHPDEDELFSAETNGIPGMLMGWSLSLVTTFSWCQ